jgi:hypothetical protein
MLLRLMYLMNGCLQCLHQSTLGRDLIGLRYCQSNGTEPVGYEHTLVVSVTVSARPNTNGIVSHMSVVLEEKSTRWRYILVAAIDVVITAEIWNIYVWKACHISFPPWVTLATHKAE